MKGSGKIPQRRNVAFLLGNLTCIINNSLPALYAINANMMNLQWYIRILEIAHYNPSSDIMFKLLFNFFFPAVRVLSLKELSIGNYLEVMTKPKFRDVIRKEP